MRFHFKNMTSQKKRKETLQKDFGIEFKIQNKRFIKAFCMKG